MASRHTVGIDLGTTHCAVATRTTGGEGRVRVLDVPELTAPGEVGRRPLLPSFLYLPHGSEFAEGELALPWGEERTRVVGDLARERGGSVPMRLVSSAKSWLCHPGVDRKAPILPVDAPEDVARVSPLEASARYLEHLAQAWDAEHPDAPIAKQDVVLTVPASFDPVARELTVEAARLAGLPELTLIEEPQAALYHWLEQIGDGWREHLSVGDVVLVVDVGGGTTDFSLIVIEEENGALAPRRLAVGDHILLGGDNMDLTLAHVIRARLENEGTILDDWQMRALTLGARAAKETLFASAESDIETVPIAIPSRGSKLIGGTIRAEATLIDATRVFLEGFFPDVPVDAAPTTRTRGAIMELGLPYAQDPAITRHLAAFLRRHGAALGREDRSFAHPTAVLFNGGVFKAQAFQQRLRHTLDAWLEKDGGTPAKMLPGADLDLACARGAAYYGAARRGSGIRIRGGTARAYYVGVEAAVPAVPGFSPPMQAVCVAPFGMEEGGPPAELADAFGLVVGESVRFRFFGSSVRRADRVGSRVASVTSPDLEELDAIEVTLSAEGRVSGDVVPVRFVAAVNEMGTLELEAAAARSKERWKIRFDLRSSR